MATWRVARSLDTLLGQLNQLAPYRSKVSDGSIGDAAHASRESDHNPFIKLSGIGIVRARDFTHDPAGGLDCNWLAKVLVASGDPRIKYVIWDRRIYTPGRGWAAYKGINAHEHHLHLSVSEQPGWFDSTLPWAGIAGSAADPISTIGTLPVPPVQEDDLTPTESLLLTRIAAALMVDQTSMPAEPIPNRIMDALVGGAGGGQALWANVSQIRADLGAILGALAARPVQANGISREELTAAVADAIPADIAEDVARHLGAKLAA